MICGFRPSQLHPALRNLRVVDDTTLEHRVNQAVPEYHRCLSDQAHHQHPVNHDLPSGQIMTYIRHTAGRCGLVVAYRTTA